MLPVYLNDQETTEEKILQRMLDRISNDSDKREGSYAWDAVAPVALELALAVLLAKEVLRLAFAQTSSGEYLAMRAAEHGVIKRQAVPATGVVSISGTPGSSLPTGLVFSTETGENGNTPSIQFMTIEPLVLDANGLGEVKVQAALAGIDGNIPAGTITIAADGRRDIQAVINPEPTTGGLEAEADDILLERYLEKVRNPGTSGNKADYRQWAMEVPGVTAVEVLSVWDGPGTVKVMVLGPGKKPASPELVAQVQAYIARNDSGEEKAPIGATVTVISGEAVYINVQAVVVLDQYSTDSIATAAIQEEFAAIIETYLSSMAFQSDTVRYARIGSALVECTGVIDYFDLLVNGETANIPLAKGQVAIVGTVILYAQ